MLALLARRLDIATITVRGLDDGIQRRLKERGAANGRSMEAEARAILTDAVGGDDFGAAWLALAEKHRGADLALPTRARPREVEL